MRLIFYDLTNQDQKGKASVISLFLKSLLGAAAVVIIALLSKSKNFYISGLVPLFPTFALIAHFIVGSERSMEDLRQTALFGLWSLLPYAAYLAAVYYFSYRFSLVTTLSAATVIWLMAASLLIVAWTKVMISV
ncbi:GlpM family protein [Vibrio vulnificus]|nr:GlpM family protein [Vibrio vulnificus]EHH0708540.1 GlpM family protein [Vibrio vulnificus]